MSRYLCVGYYNNRSVYSGTKEIQVMWDVAIVIPELFSCVVSYVNIRLDCVKIMSGYFSNSWAAISTLHWQLYQSCAELKVMQITDCYLYWSMSVPVCIGCCNSSAACSGWKEVHFTNWFIHSKILWYFQFSLFYVGCQHYVWNGRPSHPMKFVSCYWRALWYIFYF